MFRAPHAKARPAAALAALALFLPGCLGGSDTSSQTPLDASATLAEASGRIEGVVLDEEKVGVPQVRVDLLTAQRWTLTNPNGTFRFDHVPPGEHEIRATLLDLPPVVQKVLVREGEATPVTLDVRFPPVTRPYNATVIVQGFMGCNVNRVACPGYPSPNERTVFDIPVEPDLVALLVEVTWDAPVDELAWFRVEVYANTPSTPHAFAYGPPPALRLRLAGAHNFERIDMLHAKIAGDRFDTLIINHPHAAFLLEQSFTAYITKFYREDDSQAFSALPPGDSA